MKKTFLVVVLNVLAVAAVGANESPYAGQQSRNIKALSAQEIAGYLNGQGMGFAKAAELNHFPGPRHVLDLTKELALTPEQANRSQALFDGMKSEAIALGKELLDRERELDRQFATASIDPDSLRALLADIGRLQAQIRYAHLRAHLAQRALLTTEQIGRYDRLRGYQSPNGKTHDHRH